MLPTNIHPSMVVFQQFDLTVTCLLWQRKEWLSKALNEMTTDPIQEVKQYIRTVGVYLGSQNPTDEARDNAVLSLEALYDWCENYDMANGENGNIYKPDSLVSVRRHVFVSVCLFVLLLLQVRKKKTRKRTYFSFSYSWGIRCKTMWQD